MNTERQRLVRATFDAASALPEGSQDEFVRRQADGDLELADTVLRLLRAARSSGKFLMKPPLAAGSESDFRGARLGTYQIVRELGAGGMGVVYLAVRADDAFRRMAAIKVIRPEFHSPRMIERFLRERQILAQLDHPNIARIVDGGTTPASLPYFVMDYVEGRPIDVFANERQADFNQRLNLFRQACEAVKYLHANRVIHRDLKPANMLVTSGGTVKLLDFGIAKLLDNDTDAKVKTAPLLTPGYASPEQVGGKPTGVPTDIYSLGAILYELLTGTRPHEVPGRSLADTIAAITREDVRKPSASVRNNAMLKTSESATEIGRRLRGDLDSILLKALRQEPESRYSSVAAFAADVENYQAHRPVAARNGAALYSASRFTRRHWLGLAASALIAASLSWAGREEWRVHQLLTQMNDVQPAERLHSAIQPGDKVLTPQRDAQVDETVKQIAHNYDSAFPSLIRNPLASPAQGRQIADRDLTWLEQVQPEVAGKPDLSAHLGRAYLNIAEGQWSSDRPSLNDAAASLETCKRAVVTLKQIPEAYSNAPDLRQLENDLSKQMTALPRDREEQ